MTIDPQFVDFLSSRLDVQASSLGEAIDFAVREIQSGGDALTGNYNGYWLLLDQVLARAIDGKDGEAERYARFARSLLLLATGMVPQDELGPAELAALAPRIGPELVGLYQRQAKRLASAGALGLSYYPRIHALFADLEASLEHFVFGQRYSPSFQLGKDTLLVTMGSCFAENIARFLASFGFTVRNFASPEEASPQTFPRLVANILDHPDSTARDLIRDSASLCVVFTAGVGERVRLRSGEVVDASILKDNPARMRAVEAVEIYPPETIAASIREGFNALRSLNPRATMVCTVSPVPLEASFANTQGILVRSAYSKAALLQGVQQVCAGDPAISYFPSYEIVKEWAPLAGIKAFAADDGSPRHVSRNLVLIICLMFLKHFVGAAAYQQVLEEKTGGADFSRLRQAVVQ